MKTYALFKVNDEIICEEYPLTRTVAMKRKMPMQRPAAPRPLEVERSSVMWALRFALVLSVAALIASVPRLLQ